MCKKLFAKIIIGITGFYIITQCFSESTAQNLFKKIVYSIQTEFPPLESTKHSYPDDEKIPLLTDGKALGNWQQSVGWSARGLISITFKLTTPESPAMLRCHVVGGGAGGVRYPEKISVYGKNGQEKKLIGASTAHPEEAAKTLDSSWMIVDTLSEKKYDAIIVEVVPGRGMTMIDEIEMYSSIVPDILPVSSSAEKDKFSKYNGALFQTKPDSYSDKNLYSFYPENLIPISNYRIGMCYLGGTMPDWSPEMHMQKIREFGFNIVHAEGQSAWGGLRWNSINHNQYSYDWSALDRFVQNASDAGLYAVLCQDAVGGSAPSWVLRTWPDAAFINPYGETVPGIVDYGHPEVLKTITDFLAAVAKRYKNCPNIASYIIGDELSVYQNYYHTKNMGGQNFNPRMCCEFQKYLEAKYKTITAFNQNTEKPYPSFSEVTPCLKWITESSYGREWFEWCRFREVESARIYRAMYNAIKKEDPARDIILSAVYLGWSGAHVGQGVNISGHDFFDIYAEKMYLSDNPGGPRTISAWLMNVAGTLGKKKSAISNMAWNLPKKDGVAGNNSVDVYIQGIFEAVGANADNILYWSWAGKEKRQVESVYNYAKYIYENGKKYQTTQECETLRKAMPFFSKYGNIIAKTYPMQSAIGGLHPLVSFYHETRQHLTSAIAKNKYPRGSFTPSTYQVFSLKNFMVKNNYDLWLFPSPSDKKEFSKYKIISLVSNNYLQAQEEENARAFLANGGALIIDKNTGRYTEGARPHQTSLAERLADHKDKIYIFDTDPNADNKGLAAFLECNGAEKQIKIKTPGAAVGTHLLRIDENGVKGLVIILVNRANSGTPYENIDIEIKKALLPTVPFYAYAVEPYPIVEQKEIQGIDGEIFNISVGSLEHAKIIFILNKKMDDALARFATKQIEPRYKRIPWWNNKCPYRVPITCYMQSGDISFGIDLTLACSKVGTKETPVLSSLRLVRYNGSQNTVIPITVLKAADWDPVKNNCVNISFRDEVREKALPARTYYLYWSEENAGGTDDCCKVLESQWFITQADGIMIIGAGAAAGAAAEITQTENKIAVKNIPENKDGYRVFVRGSSVTPGKYELKVNGQSIVREFLDYERLIYLGGMNAKNKDNYLELAGEALKKIKITSLVIAPESMSLDKIHENVSGIFGDKGNDIEIGLMEALH